MDIKFTKSPQFATELSNFKEEKTDIYTAIKIILDIGLPPTKRGNPPLRNKYSKNS